MKLFTSVVLALILFSAGGAFADHGKGTHHKGCTCSEKCPHHAKNATGAGHDCTADCKQCAEGKGTCSDKSCALEGEHEHHQDKKAEKKG